MDPISLIGAALAAGAISAFKAAAPTVIQDAYAGLKTIIRDRYAAAQDSVERLEQSPESKGRRAVVEEELTTTGAANDADLLKQAQDLIQLVETEDPDVARTIGLDLQDFKAEEFEAEGIRTQSDAGSATGVRMAQAEIVGKASFKNVETSGGSQHPKAPEK